ncbi:MAG TPA: hypothetical protein VES42_06670 [Pilimelia sp.]|nr:hypothetical protein [Pilimelia sp.]
MGGRREKAIRLVLRLYPATVRDRYGRELAGMLRHSPVPTRDLLDAARCAVIERVGHLHRPDVRVAFLSTLALLAAPLAFGATLLTLASAAVLTLDAAGAGAADERWARSAAASAVIPVAVLAVWLGRRAGRAVGTSRRYGRENDRETYRQDDRVNDHGKEPDRDHGRRDPAATAAAATVIAVPAAFGLGTAGLIGTPLLGEMLGENPSAALVAVALWAVATAAVGGLVGSLRRRGHRHGARLAVAVGAFLIMEFCCAAYVLLGVPAEAAPRAGALWWYPAAATGIDPGLVSGLSGELSEAVKGLPAVLTVCTLFALSLASTVPRPSRAATPTFPVASA